MTLGLVVLVVVAVYGALMIGAMLCGWFWGRRKQGSRRKAAAYAGIGFLVVYLPIFWNHLPVLLRHKWLCARDAGFTQYVDPAAWRAEHADEIRRLTAEELRRVKAQKDSDGSPVLSSYGGLLESRSVIERSSFMNMPIYRQDWQLRSAADQQMLAREVDYQVGSRGDIRSWIFPSSCQGEGRASQKPMIHYIRKVEDGGE